MERTGDHALYRLSQASSGRKLGMVGRKVFVRNFSPPSGQAHSPMFNAIGEWQGLEASRIVLREANRESPTRVISSTTGQISQLVMPSQLASDWSR